MPSFIPVDHDPLADGPGTSAPNAAPDPGAPISFTSGSGGGGLQLVPVDHDPFAGASDRDTPAPYTGGDRPLTIHGGRQAPPPPVTATADVAPASRPSLAPIAGAAATLPDGFSPSADAGRPVAADTPPPAPAPSSAATRAPAPVGISYEDAAAADTANPGGVLSNATDDGYLSGAAKGAGTAIIKGMADIPGMFGGAMDLGDYLVARGQSKITGQPLDDILADQAKERKASADNPSWTRYLDPRNFLPSGGEIAAPVLAKTGEYAPTSEWGRVAQAGVEAATGSLGFGGGVKALLPNAAAGAVGQGATDLTGDPLAGLGAGIAAGPAAEAVGKGIARVAGPVVGGSALLGKAPIVGPAIQAARGNQVAQQLFDQSSDPAALRTWAAAPPADPVVPGSPQTFAGAVGNDRGLYQAEKDARNANNATPTTRVTIDGQTYGGQSFNGIDRGQSDVQIAALQGAQPTGDVFRPGQVISQRMDAIDAAAQDAVDRLTAAHADAVASRTAAGQSFANGQNADLAQRMSDRTQAGADLAGQARADLTQRTADRTQAAADQRSQVQAARDTAHAQLVQSFADAHDRQLGAAQTAAAPLGDPANMNDLGATLRGAVEEVRSGAQGLHRNLYNSVDPDGTLALVASPVQARASDIVDQVKADGSELGAAETGLFRRAAALPDVASYRALHALDKDVGAAMSTERRTAGETPSWARLSQLKGSIKGAMTGAADNQAAHEARLVHAGRMAPEDTIMARLGAKADEWDAAAQQPQAWAKTGTGGPTDTTAGTVSFRGSPGADISSGRGSRNAPGGEGLSPTAGRNAVPSAFPREVGVGPRPDAPFHDPDAMPKAPPSPGVPRPETLAGFIRRNGGIQDAGGDLASMGLHNLIAKPGRGLPADRMREAAAEAGYLGGDTARAVAETTPNDLLNRLEDGGHGHSVHDENAAAQWADYDESKAAYDRQQANSDGRSKLSVTQPSAPLSSYSVDDIYGPDGLPLPGVSRSGLSPNFDKGADNRLKAANAAYAQYAQTYKNPIVGPGLRTTGYSGQYARSDAAFIKTAVKPGPDGYENARAYLQAAANDPQALAAMQDAALNPLRRGALGNGTVHPNALARWKESYGPALRALDEVSPGFSGRFDTAAHSTQALLDLGAQHKAAMADFQAEAAARAIEENTGRKSALRAATASDKDAVGSMLQDRAAADRATNQSDRIATRSLLDDRAASDKAATAASKADMAAGISTARGIVQDAKATPAARFGTNGGNGVASTEVENAVGSFLKTGTAGATRMRGLVQSVAHDPDALQGLQKAGIDWMVRNHLTTDGSLSGAKFIGFLRDNRDTLRELFPNNQVSMFGAVARDAEAGAAWRTSTAIKGGSDSAKNLLSALSEASKSNGKHVTLGVVAVEAIAQGLDHAGLKGAAWAGAGAAGAYMANSLRQAGIKRTADLYIAALADPELARVLISKMPTTAESGTLHSFSRLLKRGLILGPIAMQGARS